jgi:hypothetical protein
VTGGSPSPHYVSESSFRAAGPVSPLAVGVGGGATFIPFWLGEGLGRQRGQGRMSNASLDTGNVEVCRLMEMVIRSLDYGAPSQSSFCCVHLLDPNFPNMWKTVLNHQLS